MANRRGETRTFAVAGRPPRGTGGGLKGITHAGSRIRSRNDSLLRCELDLRSRMRPLVEVRDGVHDRGDSLGGAGCVPGLRLAAPGAFLKGARS